MAHEKGTKLGGRGCPRCGRHNTTGPTRAVDGKPPVKFCMDCQFHWAPCSTGCRGYKLEIPKGQKGEPAVRGCEACGVPDRIARFWPEAYRAMSMALGELKALSLANPSD